MIWVFGHLNNLSFVLASWLYLPCIVWKARSGSLPQDSILGRFKNMLSCKPFLIFKFFSINVFAATFASHKSPKAPKRLVVVLDVILADVGSLAFTYGHLENVGASVVRGSRYKFLGPQSPPKWFEFFNFGFLVVGHFVLSVCRCCLSMPKHYTYNDSRHNHPLIPFWPQQAGTYNTPHPQPTTAY